MGLDDLDRQASKGGHAAVIPACSPDPGLAPLPSVLPVSEGAAGHRCSKSDRRPCTCASAARDWLVLFIRGHEHSPSAQR